MRITEEQEKLLIQKYQVGISTEELSKEFGVNRNTVITKLKKNNIEIENRDNRKKIVVPNNKGRKRRDFSAELIDEIRKLYVEEKLSTRAIGEKLDLNKKVISTLLKKNGIETRNARETSRKFELREDFFDCIDSEEKAYVLGFVMADGCNQLEERKIDINLQEQDEDILEKFCKLIYIDQDLSHVKKYKYDYKSFVKLSFHSIKMCESLLKIGCGPRKSLVLKFPGIKSDLLRHFIRGYFDGDGSINFTQNVRSLDARFSIVGTLEFCKALEKIITDKFRIHNRIDHLNQSPSEINIYSINIAGNRQVQRILEWLYEDSKIYLNRKYNKYLDLVNLSKDIDERTNNRYKQNNKEQQI